MFLCPSSLLIVSIAIPCESVIVVAKVCRAEWNVMCRGMPARDMMRSRQMLHQPLLGRRNIRAFRCIGLYFSRMVYGIAKMRTLTADPVLRRVVLIHSCLPSCWICCGVSVQRSM